MLDAAGTAQAIRAYHFGSVRFIATDTAGVAWRFGAATRAVQSLTSPQVTGGARFFVAANQEGGEVQALQGPGCSTIPSAVDQGALDPSLLQQHPPRPGAGSFGRPKSTSTSRQCSMSCRPEPTQPEPSRSGCYVTEGFGLTPTAVAGHGVAFVQGMTASGDATTAKHFPGLGRVRGNTDFTAGVVDTVTTSADPYLDTFQAAVGAGVPLVMVALATYTRIDPRHLAVFSPVVMRTMLRGRMDFRGVIVSDDLGVAQAVASVPPGSRAVQFIAAGGDLVTSKYAGPAEAMARAVLARAHASRVFLGEVHAAAAHVLAAKQRFGLLPC